MNTDSEMEDILREYFILCYTKGFSFDDTFNTVIEILDLDNEAYKQTLEYIPYLKAVYKNLLIILENERL